jgi:hypothetical protein
MTKRYEIFIADDNGWLDGCPDALGVFFGSFEHDGTYEHNCNGGILTVTGYRNARRVLKGLQTTGDWVAPEEVNPEGLETRPTYGIREAISAS